MLSTDEEAKTAASAVVPAAPDQPGVDDFREKLAILVSMGKSKEALGEQLAHDQVKKMPDKAVLKFKKRYGAWVGSKTTETLMNSFLMLATKALGAFLPIKSVDELQDELKSDYIIAHELSTFAGGVALKCGKLLAVAKAALITKKHIDYDALKEKAETLRQPVLPSEAQQC